MTPAASKAVSLAKDILGGEARAAWSADWPFEMAEGVLELAGLTSDREGYMIPSVSFDSPDALKADIPEREGTVSQLDSSLSELAKELEYLYERMQPVLTPSHPSESQLLEVADVMSPLAELVERARTIRRRVTDIHQRLDL